MGKAINIAGVLWQVRDGLMIGWPGDRRKENRVVNRVRDENTHTPSRY